jgi:tyrosine-protein kinase Etk/Wzc
MPSETQTKVFPPRAPEPLVEEQDISLFEVLSALGKRKRFLALSTGIGTAIAAAVVFLLPTTYKAEAVVMPPQQPQSTLSALAGSALGGLAAGGGVASQLGMRTQNDLYVGILGSRTIADELIEEFHLQSVYQKDTLADTRKALARRSTIENGKDTLLHIGVEDRDPKRAADLANAYVDELYKQNSRLALTDASQRRLFFEQRLATEKNELAAAEVALKKTQESNGLVVPAGQAELLIASTAQLRAELASREVEMQALRSYATDQNPRIEPLQREIDALHDQIDRLEKNTGRDGMQIGASQLPAAGLEYVRRARDVKYHETLMELLARQYEAAFLDEAKSAPVLQVVDRAVVPDKLSWPPRALLIVAAAVLIGFIASIVVLLQNYRNLSRSYGRY